MVKGADHLALAGYAVDAVRFPMIHLLPKNVVSATVLVMEPANSDSAPSVRDMLDYVHLLIRTLPLCFSSNRVNPELRISSSPTFSKMLRAKYGFVTLTTALVRCFAST